MGFLDKYFKNTKTPEKNPNDLGEFGGASGNLTGLTPEELSLYKGTYNPEANTGLNSMQSPWERRKNAVVGFGKGTVQGMALGLGGWDIPDMVDMAQGKTKEYGNFFTRLANDIGADIQKNNPIYEKDPGTFSPSDPAWWSTQFQGLGLSGGLAIEGLTESALINLFTGGLGDGFEAMKMARTLKMLDGSIEGLKTAKEIQTLNTLKKSAEYIHGGYKGLQETYTNGVQTFLDIKRDLLSKKDRFGNPVYSNEKATEYASKGASDAFRTEALITSTLGAFQYGALGFNPGKILKPLTNTTLGNIGFQMASEGFEEGWQELASQEGKHTANVLAGIEQDNTFGERFSKFVTSDAMLNNMAGGALGGLMFSGLGTVKNKILGNNFDRNITNSHKEFQRNANGYILEGTEKIAQLQSQGKFNEAEKLKKNHNRQMALNALHLDNLAEDSDNSAFTSYVTGLQDIVDKANKDEAIGFDNEYVKTVFPEMIKDANRLQNTYNTVKDIHNPNDVYGLTQKYFNLETFIETKTKKEQEIAAMQFSQDWKNLSETGKEIFNLNHQMTALINENDRLTDIKANEGNTQQHIINNRIAETQDKMVAISDRIEEINNDETYITKDTDAEILDTTLGNLDYSKKQNEISQLDNLIKSTREEIKEYKNIKKENERLNETIKTTKSKGFLTKLKEKLAKSNKLNKTTADKIDNKVELINATESSKEIERATAVNNERKEVANVAADVLSKMSQENVVTPEDITFINAINPDDAFSEPNVLKENLSDDENRRIKDTVSSYYEAAKSDFGRDLSFEEFVNDFIKHTDKTKTDTVFNALVKGWEMNNYAKDDYSRVYSKIFRDRKNIANDLIENINNISQNNPDIDKEEIVETVLETEKVLDNIIQKQNIPIEFDIEDNPVEIIHTGTVTNEIASKFAFSTRPAKQVVSKEGEVVTASYEYATEEVDLNDTVNSLPLLDPDKYLPGTKLEISIPLNFNDIKIPIYGKDGLRIKTMTFGDYVKEFNLTPDMQEYKDKIPMTINDGSNSVAMVHDVSWYHPLRFNINRPNGIEDLREAIGKTREKRDFVLNNNNKASIVITSKRQTTFNGLKVTNEIEKLPTINEANPQSIITVGGTNGELRLNRNNIFNGKLENTGKFEAGAIYNVRRYGTDIDGNPTFMAFPVFKPKINDKVRQSIQGAISVYLNKLNLTDAQKTVVENIRTQSEINILDPLGLNDYISQFIVTSNVALTNLQDIHKAASNVPQYLLIQSNSKGGGIIVGKKGDIVKQNADGLNNFSVSPASSQEDKDYLAKYLSDEFLSFYENNVSLKGLQNKKAVVYTDGRTTEVASQDYENYVKESLKTNIKSINIGTAENPNYVTNIQPVITYEIEGVAEAVNVVKEDSIVPETENIEVVETISQEEVDTLVVQAMKETAWLGEFNDNQELLEPMVLTDEQAKAQAESINRIAGLTPSQQFYVVNFIFNQVAEQVDFEGGVISKAQLQDNIKKEFERLFNPMKAHYNSQIGVFKELQKKSTDNNIPSIISRYEKSLEKIKSIEDNFDNFVKLAEARVFKFTGIVESKIGEQTEIPTIDEDYNETERSYDSSSLEEDGKHTSSYRLKRFMSGVKDLNRNGQPKNTFLNIPTYVPFDTVYNTCAGLLADKSGDFNTMIGKLEESKSTYTWLPNFIEKLNNASEQVKTEFVSTMTKHNLNMKFIAYGYDKKNSRWNLRVFDTNSNSIIQNIQNKWSNNFKNSELVINNDGVYEINKKRVESLLNQYSSWISDEVPSVNNPVLKNFEKDFPTNINETKNIQIPASVSVNSLMKGSVGLYQGKYLLTKGEGNSINVSVYNSKVVDKTELTKWLESFGIKVEPEVINQMINVGFTHNGKVFSYANLLNKSEGLLGVLAKRLEEYVNTTGNINIEEEESKTPIDEGVVKSLAKLQSQYNIGSFSNSFRDNGKSIYGYTSTKFITDRVNEMKQNPDLIDQLKTISFSKNSIWLENWDYIKDKFEISHLGLNAIQELGKRLYKDNGITSLADTDHELTKVGFMQDTKQGDSNINVNGIATRFMRFFSPTMSDKSTMTIIKTLGFDFKISDFNEDLSLKDNVKQLIYTQTIKPELERIIKFHRDVKKSNIKAYDNGAKIFLLTPEMNNLEVRDGVRLITDIEANPEMYQDTSYVEKVMMDSIYELIQDNITQLVNEKIANWTNNGYLGEEGVKYFNSNYMYKFKDALSTEKRFKLSAMDYVLNNVIFNANSFMNLIGDPAMYYKKEKDTSLSDYSGISEDTFVNVGKRLALQIAPGTKLANSKNNQYIQLFLNDRKSTSEAIEYKKRLGFDTSAYEEIEASDAQEYTTWKEHLYILRNLGRLPDTLSEVSDEELSQIEKLLTDNIPFESYTDKQKEIMEKVMQPIKPVVTGQLYDKDQDVMRVVYIKTSSFPLMPHLTKGFELDKLRTRMEGIEKKTGKTVRASYQTGNKVGAMSNASIVWGDDGNFKDNIDEDSLLNSSLIMERNNFRIQQDVPFKEDKNKITMGTQSVKLLFGDGILNIEDKIFDYNGSKIDASELHKRYNENFISLINLKTKELYNELGIDRNTNLPTDRVKTMLKLQEILKDEAVNRGYSQQDIEGLELDENGDFVLPLWASANSNRYESLLNAIVNNRIIKTKFPGNSYVMGSEEGFKFSTNVAEATGSKVIFTSAWTGKLNPAEKHDNGHFKKAQAFVPSKIRDNKGKLIDLFTKENGIYKYITQDDFGKFNLKEDMFDEGILSLTSFRIPTSGHMSMSEIEIVGFLPFTSGDLMILPKDFTKQMGLDFDIDKQNAYSYWTYQDKDGKVKRISESTSKLELADQGYSEGDISAMIFQNNIIEIHKSILGNGDDRVQKKIQRTLSIDYAKSQSEMIDKKLRSNRTTIFNPLSDEYQKQKMALGSSGKIGTGAYSLDVVFHSLVQQAALTGTPLQLTTEDGERVRFGFGNIFSEGMLGGVNTLDGGRTISEVNAERQNIAVDNEKEQVMGKVNLNDLTMDVDKVFNLLGFDKGTDGNSIAFLFLSQPIIKEYVAMMKNASSNIAEFTNNKEELIVDFLMNKYSLEKRPELNGLTVQQYEAKILDNSNLFVNLTHSDNETQSIILKRFMEMKKYGMAIREVQTTINTDSKGLGKSIFENIEKKQKLVKLDENKLINNVTSLVGDYRTITEYIDAEEAMKNGYVKIEESLYVKPTTLVGAYNVNAIMSAYNLWSDIMPYDKDGMSSRFAEIFDILGKESMSETKKVELKQFIFREIKKFINSGNKNILYDNDTTEERSRLFAESDTNTSLAKYIDSLRSIQGNPVVDEFIKNNKLIQRFETVINQENGISIIKYNNAQGEEFDEDYLNIALIEMMEKSYPLPDISGKPYNTRLLAQDLISYSYLEGGIQEAIQFSKFIPVSYLKNVGFAKRLNSFKFLNPIPKSDITHVVSSFAKQFVQHNPQRMTKVTEGDLKYISRDSDNNIVGFQLGEDVKKPAFVSIYNSNIKSSKKFDLYYLHDGVNYTKIPVVGMTGMNEYNMQNDFLNSLIKNTTGNHQVEVKNNAVAEQKAIINSVIDITRPIVDILKDISEGNTPLSKVATALTPHLGDNLEIKVVDGYFRGQFRPSEPNTLFLGKDYFNTATLEDIQKTILHEGLHSITINYVAQWLNEDGSVKAEAPSSIHKLNALFLETQKIIGIDNINKINEKIKNKTGLTVKEKEIAYAGTNLYEFITVAMTETSFQETMSKYTYKDTNLSLLDKFKKIISEILNNIGVKYNEESITFQSISTIFELLEDKAKQDAVEEYYRNEGHPDIIATLEPFVTINDLDLSNLKLDC